MNEKYISIPESETLELPVLPLKGLTVFPQMVISFDVERDFSVASVKAASEGSRLIFLVTQKDALKERPEADDLYGVGTICTIKQSLFTQNGGVRVMVKGIKRAVLQDFRAGEEYITALVGGVPSEPADKRTNTGEAFFRRAVSLYDDYQEISGNPSPETIVSLMLSSDPGYVADYITQNIFLSYTEKQSVLETFDPIKRIRKVVGILAREIEVLSIGREINDKLRTELSRIQRDEILRNQMRVIQSELGDDDAYAEFDEYRAAIQKLKLPQKSEEKLLSDVDKLSKQQFGSAEASVLRTYLDTCLELPWNKSTKERLDLTAARKILDADHFGLEKVKERIIEYLSVKKLAPDNSGAILCLVGPPGVGKTSIAISIARATNRKLARMSLGGVHDEAEIRGHRKTYVGAMPGRIINAVKQSGSNNPLILLDEVDKLGSDFRGDPSSALLEALDPEQNSTFRDHYLEIPFDLSKVFFITTANTVDTIPRPLLDRMEVIELNSYTDEEKLAIAKGYLIPKQRKKHGLNGNELRISDNAVREIIVGYTKESGVRQLEREIAAICRKTAAAIASGEAKSLKAGPDDLHRLLGARKYVSDKTFALDQVGVVKGLAWTISGGEVLEVEASVVDGSGKLKLTGNLGDVMKESAEAALTYIRSRCAELGVDPDFYKTKDIHVHFPEGAIPKDGPSAGVTMATAMISALTGATVKRNVAMTGEITLNGRVLPIGGLKEKTMAALRSGAKTVIIPAENERDLDEIDQTVRRSLNFVTAAHIGTVIDTALNLPPIKSPERKTAAMTEGANRNIRPDLVIRQ